MKKKNLFFNIFTVKLSQHEKEWKCTNTLACLDLGKFFVEQKEKKRGIVNLMNDDFLFFFFFGFVSHRKHAMARTYHGDKR